MRINKPRSFIGGKDKVDAAYNLVTSKELTSTETSITNAYENLIKGERNNALGSYGYAWLTSDGKIDPSLMPSLAISETRILHETDLYPNGLPSGITAGQNKNAVEEQLATYILEQAENAAAGNGGFYTQRGDIFVVTPSEGTQPNPNVHGSFIVTISDKDTTMPGTNAVGTAGMYKVSRLSYDNGNIIIINDKVLDDGGTPGSITLYLHDILKEKYFVDAAVSADVTSQFTLINQAKELESTIYRLHTVADADGHYRFGFTDYDNETIVKYAKLVELETVSGALDSKINREVQRLDNAINYLSGAIDDERYDRIEAVQNEANERAAADAFISGVLDDTNLYLGERGQEKSKAANSSITQQVNQLRYELDNRTIAISGIYFSVYDLITKFKCLADNSVLLKYVELDWNSTQGDVTVTNYTENNKEFSLWEYVYTPTSYQEHFTGEDFPERIIAIYDEDNDIIYPDITVDKTTGKTTISVNIELSSNNANDDTLSNVKWTLLVAEPIKRINTLIGDTNDPEGVKINAETDARKEDISLAWNRGI